VEALQRARANRAERIAAYRREHAAPHPAPAPVVAAKPAPVNQSGNKQFHITTLVSPRRQNADILAAALRKRGINVHTQRVGGGWAVETPGYHNKAEADSAAKQLQKSGYNAGVSTQ